ncbi:hypothetical protein ACAG26_14120 [Mycobacterium sp. pUA109]|uniref:hypothetical protein n=1 Tax=Mycobacterium sp. pUA109 TaxID=3238982 RepID=UPI00351BDFD3
MAETKCCGSLRSAEQSLLAATFLGVRRCPARADYIELCFETNEGVWTWCIPEPCEQRECGSGDDTLAITTGPYGAQARYFQDGNLGFALPSPEAMALITGGSRAYVARKLVERGW